MSRREYVVLGIFITVVGGLLVLAFWPWIERYIPKPDNGQTPGLRPTTSISGEPTPPSRIEFPSTYTREYIDQLLGLGNWACIQGFPNGIKVRNLPPNFIVREPWIQVDRSDKPYFTGETVLGGGVATVWLPNISRIDNCPSVYNP
jgi:hypothetical protein